MNKGWKQLLGLILLCGTQTISFAESPKLTLAKIQEKHSLIQSAASTFDVNAQYLSAIIYVERTLNYDWTDEMWDLMIAKAGKNSSIGFCQVKLKTAYFIEHQLHNIHSVFFPGKSYTNILKISKNPQALIEKLSDDSLNILYAAAYLKMMQTRWVTAGYPIDKRPDIFGTLYSTGLFHNNGNERLPHANPKSNDFGKKVLKAIDLF